MKRKHIIFGVLALGVVALLGGTLVDAPATTESTIETSAEGEVEKTFFDKTYTSINDGDYDDSDSRIQNVLGLYEGHLLKTVNTLCWTGGKMNLGPYFVVQVNADEGHYITSLKWEATGRFYYSSGLNDPTATLYVSTDPTNFENPVKEVRGEYGSYETRTKFNADLTPYLPEKASTIYIKYIIKVYKNSNSFSNDWFKIDKLKISGKQIPVAQYVAPAKTRALIIEDDFSKVHANASNAYYFENVEGRGSGHTLVPGIWGDPVKMLDGIESFIEYKIPAGNIGLVGTTKVNLNAKIWNQNDPTVHNENAISVYAGISESNLSLVKTFHCTDSGAGNNYVDLAEVDVTNYVAGAKTGLVKIVLTQSRAVNVTAGTMKYNTKDGCPTSEIALDNIGVKLGKVKITSQAVYQCPGVATAFLTKDYSVDDFSDAVSVTGFTTGNPEGSYYGMYNPNPANMASLVYKFDAESRTKHITELKYAFTNSRYAYYSGDNNTLFKLSVSTDNVNYTNVVTDELKSTALSQKEFDLTAAVSQLHSSVVYLKIEEGSKNPGMGSNKAWFVLKNVTVTGKVVQHSNLTIKEGKVVCDDCLAPVMTDNYQVLEFYGDQYLKINSYFESLGYCSDSTHHYYADAKAMLSELSVDQRLLLRDNTDFTSLMARLRAWATANGEKLVIANDGTISPSPILEMDNFAKDNVNVMLIVIASSIVLLSFTAVVLKKKHTRAK